MRLGRILPALLVVVAVLAGCGDDDAETSGDQDDTPAETTEDTAGETSTTAPPDDPPSTASSTPPMITVQVPASLTGAMEEAPSDDHAWFATLHRTADDGAAGYLGTGISPEPAEVIDPQASIVANQALAAAHGVAGDLLTEAGDAEQLVSEETTVSGRPAWHVRLRFHGPDVPAEVDLVGFEDSGSFQYAVAVTQGLDDGATAELQAAVADATTS